MERREEIVSEDGVRDNGDKKNRVRGIEIMFLKFIVEIFRGFLYFCSRTSSVFLPFSLFHFLFRDVAWYEASWRKAQALLSQRVSILNKILFLYEPGHRKLSKRLTN